MARPGFFYPPTILADIPEGCPAYDDEIFGPVASLFKVCRSYYMQTDMQVHDIDEAISRANHTRYGLGSSVFTNDESEQERFINEIESGLTYVNSVTSSEAQAPFGGVKESGYRKELGDLGFFGFINPKTVYVN